MGIYRLSGTTSRVQRLKACLDRGKLSSLKSGIFEWSWWRTGETDLDGTDLMSEDNLSDINDIAAVLKLWFRELPEPLLTWELYHQFIDVSSAFLSLSPLSLFSRIQYRWRFEYLVQRLKMIDYDTFDYMNEWTNYQIQTMRLWNTWWDISTSTFLFLVFPSQLILTNLPPSFE